MWGVWRRWRSHQVIPDDEVGEEIRDHLRRRSADLVARGLTPDAAARQAAIEFGGVENYKEQTRQVVRGTRVGVYVEQAWLELTRAVRRLARTPVFTVFSIVSIAIGVGVTASGFAIFDDWTTPLRIPNADRIAVLDSRGNWKTALTDTDLDLFLSRQHTLSKVVSSTAVRDSFQVGNQSYPLTAEAVSAGYFDMLGITPLAGRLLVVVDGQAESEDAVVIGERFWRERLGADPAAVGSAIALGGVPFTVVGIIPDKFPGLTSNPFDRTECWMPRAALRRFHLDESTSLWVGRSTWVTTLGVPAPGMSFDDVARDAHAIGAQLDDSDPTWSEGPDTIYVRLPRRWSALPLANIAANGRRTKGFLIALFFVGMTFVVACTNLANLMLARGVRRHTERTVRRALGASRLRLTTEVALEGVLLALAGGSAAMVVAQFLMYESARRFQFGQRIVFLAPQWSVEALTIVLTTVSLGFIVFGLIPAWRLSAGRRLAMTNAIAEPPRLRSGLVVTQIAVASALMLVGAMCVRAAQDAERHDTGVDYGRVSMATLKFYATGSAMPGARASEAAILKSVQARPEFEEATVTSGVPFGDPIQSLLRVATPDETALLLRSDRPSRLASAITTTPGLFRTLDIAITHGRALDERDQPGPNPNIVINSELAKSAFGTEDAVGRTLLLRGDAGVPDKSTLFTAQVVGVTEPTDTGSLFDRSTLLVYLPRNQIPTLYSLIVARCRVPSETGVGALLAAIHQADPSVAVGIAGTGSEMLTGGYAYLVPFGEGFGTLGVLAGLIASLGLYGVMSELISRRTQELGVRLALGAQPSALVRMTVSDGLKPVLIGLPIGLLVAVVGRKLLQHGGVTMGQLLDPVGLFYASAPLLFAALWACYWPARRASRVDPTIVLRAE